MDVRVRRACGEFGGDNGACVVTERVLPWGCSIDAVEARNAQQAGREAGAGHPACMDHREQAPARIPGPVPAQNPVPSPALADEGVWSAASVLYTVSNPIAHTLVGSSDVTAARVVGARYTIPQRPPPRIQI